MWRSTLSLAWRDLRGSRDRVLWLFVACLLLGVALIALGGSLAGQLGQGLRDGGRALFGGDLRVETRTPLEPEPLAWLEANGEVSLLVEMRTMLRTPEAGTTVVEVQSPDANYPLYGELLLEPAIPLAEALAQQEGRWGTALDARLAQNLGLEPGDTVSVGEIELTIRTLIQQQPDRSFNADWRGQPVLIHPQALEATGLVGFGSLMDYEYRVKTPRDPAAWRSDLVAAFPATAWEVDTFEERGERLARRLDQVTTVVVLIGFATLCIGGLGVVNSVRAYLDGKLASIATLRALGMRELHLATVFVWQILLLAGLASGLGVLLGGGLALLGAGIAGERLPVALDTGAMLWPLAMALLFGICVALAFALPLLGRALGVNTAALFRGQLGPAAVAPPGFRLLTGLAWVVVLSLLLIGLPRPGLGIVVLLGAVLLWGLLEGLVRVLQNAARRLGQGELPRGRFGLRLALANLHRPGAPMRPILLSLGTALTLLVALSITVAETLQTLRSTLPGELPALVFYDVANYQQAEFQAMLDAEPSMQRAALAPLVLGRLQRVNGESLAESDDPYRANESLDEHKLSDPSGNLDGVSLIAGEWWPEDYQGPPLVAMEDREALPLGLEVGDTLVFNILGREVEAELAAIFGNRRVGTLFWLEAIFSPGVLDPFISRYVGVAYLPDEPANDLQQRLAAAFPNVVSIYTVSVLAQMRQMLAGAATGLGAVAGSTLLASLLVLASVVATCRSRQLYEAGLLHTLGARLGVIRASLGLEYGLLALLTAGLTLVLGSALALGIIRLLLELEGSWPWPVGIVTALGGSVLCLALGAGSLLRAMREVPVRLLRLVG